MGFWDDLRKGVTSEDLEYLETQREPPAAGIWRNSESPDWPDDLKKPIEEMTDAEILEIAEYAGLRNQALSLGVPMTEHNVEVFWDRFQCQHCGRCCVEPIVGGIGVMPSEQARLGARLGLSGRVFRERYTVVRNGGFEMPCPCVFRLEGRCSAYEVRPLVCRVFPLELSMAKAIGELAVQAVCPGARKVFVEQTKRRRDEVRGSVSV